VGDHQAKFRIGSATEMTAVDQLATHIFMLDEIEKGNLTETKRILQAETGPQLDLLMDYGFLTTNPSRDIAFRCKLVQKLKDYRNKNSLFRTPEWEYLWKVPGMRDAENRRIEFLDQTAPSLCHWKSTSS